MTPEQVLDKYRGIVAVNSERIALELSQHLRKLTQEQQRAIFGGHHHYGFFWLFRHDSHPDKVMECVVSTAGDAITSVYVNHNANENIGTLLAARAELINAISDKIGLSVEAIGIDDPGRGRTVGLNELCTGQLIDILTERMGASVAVTSSIGGDLAAGAPA
jgi:hypothetical protein